jgi:hypothetical protein
VLIETTDLTYAGRERDVGVGQVGGLDEHPRGLRAPGAGQRERAGTELAGEEPGEVARGVPDVVGQTLDALPVDDAVGDQPHRPAGRGRGDVPVRAAGGGVGQAALAGPEAGGLRGGGTGEERHVLEAGRPRRAGGAAVDAGGPHGGVEHAVEAPVPRLDRAVAGLPVQLVDSAHGSIMTAARADHSRESDTTAGSKLQQARSWSLSDW